MSLDVFAIRRGRRGFTLMEALVVISIIGMVMAILLPAVQASREAARANTCKNNLRQMGLALLNHESALKRFPSGGWGFRWYGDPDRGSGLAQPGSWSFSVLPYVERRDLATFGAGQTGQAKLQAVAQTNEIPVSLFYCPSRRAAATYPFDMQFPPRNAAAMSAAAKSDYAVNGGDFKLHSHLPQVALGISAGFPGSGGPLLAAARPRRWPGQTAFADHAAVTIRWRAPRQGVHRAARAGEKKLRPGLLT
jgi:prepilin-type N-terminal cleavage/methylation domain-containing protein